VGCVSGQFGGYLECSFRLSSFNIWNLVVDTVAYCHLLLSSLIPSAYNARLEWYIFLLANLQGSQGTSFLPMRFYCKKNWHQAKYMLHGYGHTDTGTTQHDTLHPTNFRKKQKNYVQYVCLTHVWSRVWHDMALHLKCSCYQRSGYEEIVMVFVKRFPVLYYLFWLGRLSCGCCCCWTLYTRRSYHLDSMFKDLPRDTTLYWIGLSKLTIGAI